MRSWDSAEINAERGRQLLLQISESRKGVHCITGQTGLCMNHIIRGRTQLLQIHVCFSLAESS